MIVHTYKGKAIDTENMSNNKIYTYILNKDKLEKIEVNFELQQMKSFLEKIRQQGIEKEGIVEKIEYNIHTKQPIASRPYDEIVDIMFRKEDLIKRNSLLENDYFENIYLKWIEYPNVYFKIKELIDFKTEPVIGREKTINLIDDYIKGISEYNLEEEMLSVLKLKKVNEIEISKIKSILDYENNGFINMNIQIKNAKKYLDYGEKNKELIKKMK